MIQSQTQKPRLNGTFLITNYELVLAVMFGGVMAELAGGYLSLAYTPLWTENMTAGRGWVAIALVVLATWKPKGNPPTLVTLVRVASPATCSTWGNPKTAVAPLGRRLALRYAMATSLRSADSPQRAGSLIESVQEFVYFLS
ncbi:hypothetical protein A6770_18020 [Nostoc minutum NIES-26]|uniref:Uncharacterized protein n=1 Tax=Nostoc minutum NIES-26 TaxID=1844469 RepID=A0A367RDB9_9NOSO|nr:hypothetical protein A6770_18020 [Nostoc minutum NIES-26]